MEKNCGFCGSSGCEQVDDTFREQLADMLDTLLLDSATLRRNGLACDECAEKVTKAFQFKQNWTLMETHSSILDENAKCCQLCRDILKADAAVPLMNLVEDDGVKTVLQRHLPEVNLEQIRNLEVCDTCEKHLTDIKSLFFLSDCLELRHKALEIVKLEDRFASTADQCMEIEEACFGNDAMIKTEIQDEEIERIEYVTVEDLKVFAEAGGSGPGVKVEPEDEGTELKQEEIDIKSEDERSARREMDPKQVGLGRNSKTKTRNISKCLWNSLNVERSKLLTCDTCHFSAPTKRLLRRHLSVHKDRHEEKAFRCSLCPYESKYSKDLRFHMFIKHDDTSNANVISCKLCAFKTIQKNRLERHMIVHKETKLKCALCSFETKNKHAIRCHTLLKHEESSPGVGENVELETSNLNVQEESEIEMYKCTHCNFGAKTSKGLRCHMTVKHDETPKILTCESCDFKCLQPSVLRDHTVKHGVKLGTKVHKCECGYETKYSARFQNHLALRHGHDDPKFVKCPLCDYKCLNPSVMETHVIAHGNKINAESFTCQLCEFVTKYKKNLKGHMIVKHGETSANMQECDVCQYKTLYKKDMKRHMIIHMDKSEVKYYKCEFCDLESKYKNNMQTHVALVHGNVSQK